MSTICHCIKDDIFEFLIDLKADYLVYTDYSHWLVNSKIQKEFTEFTLTITNYETNVGKDFTVKPNLSAIIKYSELPMENKYSCPPDGIYKFSVNVCQGTQIYTKVQAVLINSQKAYETLIKQNNWEAAYEVLKYMEYIKVFSNENNIKKAVEYHQILQKLLKKLKCDCNEWSLQLYKSCSNI